MIEKIQSRPNSPIDSLFAPLQGDQACGESSVGLVALLAILSLWETAGLAALGSLPSHGGFLGLGNGYALRLGRLALGQPQIEHPIHEVGLNLVGVHRRR